MVLICVRYLFYQPMHMDEKIKTWTLCFPAKETSDMDKALLDCPIVFFSAELSLNRSISARLLFLFCSRVFFSRSYENSSNTPK